MQAAKKSGNTQIKTSTLQKQISNQMGSITESLFGLPLRMSKHYFIAQCQ